MFHPSKLDLLAVTALIRGGAQRRDSCSWTNCIAAAQIVIFFPKISPPPLVETICVHREVNTRQL